MKNNYPFLRDAVLEMRNWTFATARDVWETQDKDGWGEQYAYNVSSDWLAIYRVYREINSSVLNPRAGSSDDLLDKTWRMESNQLISDYPKVYVWGLKRVTDTGKFTTLFVQALAARIAADACVPLTENRTLQADMWNLFEVKLREASTRDGQQGSNDVVQSSTLVEARGRVF
jgi:hypothetical protein